MINSSVRRANWMRCAVLIGAAWLLAGCAAWLPRPPIQIDNEPQAGPHRQLTASRPLALVLSGGAARGFAHVGVIKVLEREGIKPDLIVGTSAGGIVGALYASGMSAAQLEEEARSADGGRMLDPDWMGLVTLKNFGLLRGEGLSEFVNEKVGRRKLEELPIPFAAVAVDLRTGKLAAFNRGDTGVAVRASSAVPGVFMPVPLRDGLYADGGLVSPLPAATARAMGAKIVIAVDVVYPPGDSTISNPLSVLFQTFLIQTYRLREYELKDADLVIAPLLPSSGQLGFSDRDWIIRAGEEAASAALPKIRELLRNQK